MASASLWPPLTSSDAESQQRQEQAQGPGPVHGSPLAQARGAAVVGTAPVFPVSSQEVFTCERALGALLGALRKPAPLPSLSSSGW